MLHKVLNEVSPLQCNYTILYGGQKVTCSKSYSSLGRDGVKLLVENIIINKVLHLVTYVIFMSAPHLSCTP